MDITKMRELYRSVGTTVYVKDSGIGGTMVAFTEKPDGIYYTVLMKDEGEAFLGLKEVHESNIILTPAPPKEEANTVPTDEEVNNYDV